MIQEIITQWDTNKHKLEKWFRENNTDNYDSYIVIVRALFTHVIEGYDVDNITVIDNGDYQGTQLFIIPKTTYQPSAQDYIVTDTYYGSCSGCDTLLGIVDFHHDLPDEQQVKELMTLALHLVQKMRTL